MAQRCYHHPYRNAVVFCKSCQLFLCQECVVVSHQPLEEQDVPEQSVHRIPSMNRAVIPPVRRINRPVEVGVRSHWKLFCGSTLGGVSIGLIASSTPSDALVGGALLLAVVTGFVGSAAFSRVRGLLPSWRGSLGSIEVRPRFVLRMGVLGGLVRGLMQ